MKLLILFSLFTINAYSSEDCFIYKQNGKIISSGECSKRHPPQSTFKIAISLMGFNDGILVDETRPLVPFVKGYPDDVEAWKRPHNPKMWMKNSCVWYSQFVTKQLGMEKFKSYLKSFNYGNQDASGVKRKPDGLISSWITSSLEISPQEQISFLENMLDSKLSVSAKAVEYTRNILYLEEMTNNWKLFGKTGTGDLINKNGTQDKAHERGWFIGWIEKNKERIIFAQYVEIKNIKTQENHFGYVASKQAKELAKDKLSRLAL